MITRALSIKTKSLTFLNLSLKNRYKMSIHNYMKTYPSENLSTHHGRARVDEYKTAFSTPESLQKFSSQEAALYSKQSSKWQQRTQVYLDIVNSRKDERNQSSSEILNGYQYYTVAAWHEGREYTKIFRNKIGSTKEELVLDFMKYQLINRYFQTVELVRTTFSHCGNYVAFGFDLHNNQQISYMIKNISKNNIVGIQGWEENRIKGVDNLVFGTDNDIFYTKVKNYRPSQLWHQNMKTGKSTLIHEQKDAQFYIDLSLSKDRNHLIINSNSKQSSKIWSINLSTPKKQGKYQLKQLIKSTQNMKVNVNHNGNSFVIWKDSISGSEIILKNQQTGKQEIIHKIKQDSGETITDIDVFDKYIVLYIRRIVSPVIRILTIKQNGKIEPFQIALAYEIGTVHPGVNQMLSTDTFLFYLNNIFVYNEGYSYNFETKKLQVVQPFKMTGPKFNPKDYLVNIHEVPSEDGQMVPLTTIVPKKYKGRTNKMLLHFYGYYGLAYEISFNNVYWAALEMGWSLAYAHIRGGGEKGVKWHKAAIKQGRWKNFRDLEDCVAYLVKNQYTHPNILVLSSHSAGAITVWNTISHYPHMFKAAIMSYPFLDVLGSLLDPSKPLTESDYPQFGNPVESSTSYTSIESYSPYDNIVPQTSYPFIYLIAGTKDYRCPMQQIAKFVSRYRHVREWKEGEERIQEIGKKGLLVKVNEASHEGIAEIKEQIRDGCQMLACLDFVIEDASFDVRVQ